MSKTRFLLIAGLLLVATPAAQAQIGSGWTRKTYTKKIHLDNESGLQNEYSSGQRQFQGFVTFFSPLNDESLFQIFGSTSGATLCMMRGYSAAGGTLRTVGGGGTLSTGCYGRELRVNVIHSQNQFVEFYVNGSRQARFSEAEPVTNYWKYGVYGTLRTPAVTVRWRQVRLYSK